MVKKNAIRFLAALLALCLSFGTLAPVTVFATESGVPAESTPEESTPAESTPEESTPAEEPAVEDYATFLENVKILQDYADAYAASSKEDAGELVLNFVRCGVERYMEGLWSTLAGEEITEFTEYVQAQDEMNGTNVMILRNIEEFAIPNGQIVDFGHMFGTMNISYITGAVATDDLAGWAGDICDLLYYSHNHGNVPEGTVDEMANYVRVNCFGVDADDAYGMDDFYGDMDAYYLVSMMEAGGKLDELMEDYFTEELTDGDRATYFLNNRFKGKGLETREDVRNEVYNTYIDNLAIEVLESDRELKDVDDLRTACCYAFADYVYELVGDRLDTGKDEETGGEEGDDDEDQNQGGGVEPDNEYYSVFSNTESTLAPGITQSVKYAYTKDNKQIAYYVATIDIRRDDVSIFANYKDNDPSAGWGMQRTTEQMLAAQERHSNPEDAELYIENYTPVVGINADFYNMGNGAPSGALVMEGVQYNGVGNENFFAILKDGTPVIGTKAEWSQYEGQVQEAVGGSIILLRDGQMVESSGDYYTARGPRSVVGITADGKVVFVVIDGRQEPFSAGATAAETAQVMLDAGCVIALHLDGGGSATYAAKPEGSDTVKVISSPSDGYERSVSSSLMAVSTAVVSNEFERAVISSEYDYLTIGSQLELTAIGVSASGNAADVPENAVWQVSDASIGTIENGVFTAAANGEVEVQIAVDGVVVGQKTLHVVIPDALLFEKETMNAIYGVPVELPLNATYNGNPVKYNMDDVFLMLEDDAAGVIDGLSFTGNEESGIRSVLAGAFAYADDSLMATIQLNMFKDGEAVFDFDNVTAGDRKFAWVREVSNSETLDGVVFQVSDPTQGMEVSYTFALDMREIEIPEKLQDIVYMLPGGDVEGKTAWEFLLQLAERVSVKTEVRVTAQVDPELEVDISDVTVVNDYFYSKEVLLDEETNTLTIVCGWIDQTQAIDPLTANPICILSGLRATPKNGAAWDAEDQLNVDLNGEVSYNIFLRANALYNFACEEENQEEYGLVPFVHEDIIINDAPEKGASFGDVYTTFADSFVLDSTNRQGWVQIENQLYYFVNNVCLTGIQYVPGYEDSSVKLYYNFGEDGACVGTINGLFNNNGNLYFAVQGEARTGWQTVGNANADVNYYYFDAKNGGAAVDGVQKIGGYTYTFTDYVLTRGEIVKDSKGYRYRWAGQWESNGWIEVDGNIYFAMMNGYFDVGLKKRYAPDGVVRWYCFDNDGRWMQEYSGFRDFEGATYLVKDGYVQEYPGLVKIGEDYYMFDSAGKMVKGKTDYWVSKPNGIVPEGRYSFAEDGKMILDGVFPEEVPEEKPGEVKNGIVEENGKLFYYENGVKTYAGLIEIDGYYYYVKSNCEAVRDGEYWITKTNGIMPEGRYPFDEQGRMIIEVEEEPKNGLVEEDGKLFYYVNDVKKTDAGLVRIVLESGEVNYYYFCDGTSCNLEGCAQDGSAVVGGVHWVEDNNNLLPQNDYTFDANGVIEHHEDTSRNGIYPDENGVDYYYIDGVKAYVGLVKIGDNYYYVRTSGEVVKGKTYWISKTNGIVPEGNYVIDENGVVDFGDVVPGEPDVPEENPDEDETPTVKNGIVEENGDLYYYVNGVKTYAGVIIIDEEYYYVNSACRVIHGCTYWISKTNDLLPEKAYTFADDGHIIFDEGQKPGETPDENPDEGGETPEVKNGIVEEGGKLYYYVDGVKTYAGLIEIDGYYYYVKSNCEVVRDGEFWITKTNGIMSQGRYPFDAQGRMIIETEEDPGENPGEDPDDTPDVKPEVKNGIVEEGGKLYYYVDGVRTYAGLIEIDGYYYYVKSNCEAVRDGQFWITKTNGIMKEGRYTFDAQGRMVL